MTDNEKLEYLKGQGIDAALGMKYADDSLEFYEELIALFVDEYEGKHLKVKEAVKCQWKDYTVLLHSLKNNAKALGALELAELSYAHEKASKAGEGTYISENIEELMACWKKTVQIFREMNN